MPKGNPQDVKDMAEDLKGCIQRHPDAIRNNPDLATDLVKLRDKTERRYEEISEGRKS